MSDSTRGGMVVAIIVFSLVMYYFLWVKTPATPVPATSGNKAGPPAVNYLDKTPVIPVDAKMQLGEAAPDFTYYTIKGDEIKLSSFIGRKPVVLDFWATWCGPCRQELPELQEFYAAHSDQVEIIAVSIDDRQVSGEVAATVGRLGLTFPIVHDSSRAIYGLFPSPGGGIPYLVFIDKNGTAIDQKLGFDPAGDLGQEILGIFGLGR